MPEYKLRSIVYHGTSSNCRESLLNKIDLNLCDEKTDFGRGFYVTTDFNQAKIWACRLTEAYNQSVEVMQRNGLANVPDYARPIVIEYSLDTNSIWGLNKYVFSEADDNWRKFVYNNRNNRSLPCHARHNCNGRYDVVIGPMADGTKFGRLILVNKGLLSEEDFLTEITPKGSQISFHTQRVLNYVSAKGVIWYEEI